MQLHIGVGDNVGLAMAVRSLQGPESSLLECGMEIGNLRDR